MANYTNLDDIRKKYGIKNNNTNYTKANDNIKGRNYTNLDDIKRDFSSGTKSTLDKKNISTKSKTTINKKKASKNDKTDYTQPLSSGQKLKTHNEKVNAMSLKKQTQTNIKKSTNEEIDKKSQTITDSIKENLKDEQKIELTDEQDTILNNNITDTLSNLNAREDYKQTHQFIKPNGQTTNDFATNKEEIYNKELNKALNKSINAINTDNQNKAFVEKYGNFFVDANSSFGKLRSSEVSSINKYFGDGNYEDGFEDFAKLVKRSSGIDFDTSYYSFWSSKQAKQDQFRHLEKGTYDASKDFAYDWNGENSGKLMDKMRDIKKEIDNLQIQVNNGVPNKVDRDTILSEINSLQDEYNLYNSFLASIDVVRNVYDKQLNNIVDTTQEFTTDFIKLGTESVKDETVGKTFANTVGKVGNLFTVTQKGTNLIKTGITDISSQALDVDSAVGKQVINIGADFTMGIINPYQATIRIGDASNLIASRLLGYKNYKTYQSGDEIKSSQVVGAVADIIFGVIEKVSEDKLRKFIGNSDKSLSDITYEELCNKSVKKILQEYNLKNIAFSTGTEGLEEFVQTFTEYLMDGEDPRYIKTTQFLSNAIEAGLIGSIAGGVGAAGAAAINYDSNLYNLNTGIFNGYIENKRDVFTDIDMQNKIDGFEATDIDKAMKNDEILTIVNDSVVGEYDANNDIDLNDKVMFIVPNQSAETYVRMHYGPAANIYTLDPNSTDYDERLDKLSKSQYASQIAFGMKPHIDKIAVNAEASLNTTIDNINTRLSTEDNKVNLQYNTDDLSTGEYSKVYHNLVSQIKNEIKKGNITREQGIAALNEIKSTLMDHVSNRKFSRGRIINQQTKKPLYFKKLNDNTYEIEEGEQTTNSYKPVNVYGQKILDGDNAVGFEKPTKEQINAYNNLVEIYGGSNDNKINANTDADTIIGNIQQISKISKNAAQNLLQTLGYDGILYTSVDTGKLTYVSAFDNMDTENAGMYIYEGVREFNKEVKDYLTKTAKEHEKIKKYRENKNYVEYKSIDGKPVFVRKNDKSAKFLDADGNVVEPSKAVSIVKAKKILQVDKDGKLVNAKEVDIIKPENLKKVALLVRSSNPANNKFVFREVDANNPAYETYDMDMSKMNILPKASFTAEIDIQYVISNAIKKGFTQPGPIKTYIDNNVTNSIDEFAKSYNLTTEQLKSKISDYVLDVVNNNKTLPATPSSQLNDFKTYISNFNQVDGRITPDGIELNENGYKKLQNYTNNYWYSPTRQVDAIKSWEAVKSATNHINNLGNTNTTIKNFTSEQRKALSDLILEYNRNPEMLKSLGITKEEFSGTVLKMFPEKTRNRIEKLWENTNVDNRWMGPINLLAATDTLLSPEMCKEIENNLKTQGITFSDIDENDKRMAITSFYNAMLFYDGSISSGFISEMNMYTDSINTGGHAFPLTSQIELNKKVFNKDNILEGHSSFTGSTNIIVHELGHALDYLLGHKLNTSYNTHITTSVIENTTSFFNNNPINQKISDFIIQLYSRLPKKGTHEAVEKRRKLLISDTEYLYNPSEVFARFVEDAYSKFMSEMGYKQVDYIYTKFHPFMDEDLDMFVDILQDINSQKTNVIQKSTKSLDYARENGYDTIEYTDENGNKTYKSVNNNNVTMLSPTVPIKIDTEEVVDLDKGEIVKDTDKVEKTNNMLLIDNELYGEDDISKMSYKEFDDLLSKKDFFTPEQYSEVKALYLAARTHFVDRYAYMAQIANKYANQKIKNMIYQHKTGHSRISDININWYQTDYNNREIKGSKSIRALRKEAKAYGKDFMANLDNYINHMYNIERLERGKPEYLKGVTLEDSKKEISKYTDIQKSQMEKFVDYFADYRNNQNKKLGDAGMLDEFTQENMAKSENYKGYRYFKPAYVGNYDRTISMISGDLYSRYSETQNTVNFAGTAPGDLTDVFDAFEIREKIINKNIARNKLIQELAIDGHYTSENNNKAQLVYYVDGQKRVLDTSVEISSVFEQNAFGKQMDKVFSTKMLSWIPKVKSFTQLLYTGDQSSVIKGLINVPFQISNAIRDFQDSQFYSIDPARFEINYARAVTAFAIKNKYFKDAVQGGLIVKPNNIFEVVEFLPKLADFISCRDSGYDILTSVEMSQDTNLNFSTSGQLVSPINRYVTLFFNAGIQGVDKFITTNAQGFDNGNAIFKTILKYGKVIGTHALYGLMTKKQQEKIDRLPDYVTATNYVFFINDNDYVVIPMGRVQALWNITTNITKIGADYNVKDFIIDFKDSLSENFVPDLNIPVYELIKGAWDAAIENKDAFGNSIYNENDTKNNQIKDATAYMLSKLGPYGQMVGKEIDSDKLNDPRGIDYFTLGTTYRFLKDASLNYDYGEYKEIQDISIKLYNSSQKSNKPKDIVNSKAVYKLEQEYKEEVRKYYNEKNKTNPDKDVLNMYIQRMNSIYDRIKSGDYQHKIIKQYSNGDMLVQFDQGQYWYVKKDNTYKDLSKATNKKQFDKAH